MIRINLLPIKQDRRKEAGRNQILIGIIVILAAFTGAALVYLNLSADVDQQKNANKAIKTQVSRIEKRVKDHNSILKEIEEYESRQQAIDNLLSARTGPVFVMLEISKIMSKSGRPHLDHDKYQQMIQVNPSLAFDENWDYRRLWISTFKEADRQINIKGQGITHEDVAEFLRRINLSDFFVASDLVSTKLESPRIPKQGFANKEADPVVSFEISGQVRYQ